MADGPIGTLKPVSTQRRRAAVVPPRVRQWGPASVEGEAVPLAAVLETGAEARGALAVELRAVVEGEATGTAPLRVARALTAREGPATETAATLQVARALQATAEGEAATRAGVAVPGVPTAPDGPVGLLKPTTGPRRQSARRAAPQVLAPPPEAGSLVPLAAVVETGADAQVSLAPLALTDGPVGLLRPVTAPAARRHARRRPAPTPTTFAWAEELAPVDLAATGESGAEPRAALTVTRALAAVAEAEADPAAAVAVARALAGTAAGEADGRATLAIPGEVPLAATLETGADEASALAVARALTATAEGAADAAPALTVLRRLQATVAGAAAPTAMLRTNRDAVALAAVLETGADARGAPRVARALAATLEAAPETRAPLRLTLALRAVVAASAEVGHAAPVAAPGPYAARVTVASPRATVTVPSPRATVEVETP